MTVVPSLFGRDALLAAADHHPYAVITSGGPNAQGYQRDGALVWIADGPWGPMCGSLGDATTCAELMLDLAPSGILAGLWCHLPQDLPDELGRRLGRVPEWDWEMLWTTESPAAQYEVSRLGPQDDAEVNDVLDDGFPDSSSRPGAVRVRAWYGIREQDKLVAVGADRSVNGVGFLAGIATRQAVRGKGYGKAITAGMTSALLAEHGACALAVMTLNTNAYRMYRDLGYGDQFSRTSVMLDPSK